MTDEYNIEEINLLGAWELISVWGERFYLELMTVDIVGGGTVEITMTDEDGNTAKAQFNAFAFTKLGEAVHLRVQEAKLAPPLDYPGP